MKRKLIPVSLVYSLFFFIASCVTINIYFPAAAVEKAADRIVEEVWGEKESAPEKTKDENKPQSFLNQILNIAVIAAGPRDAHAQEADINVTTPAIRALKSSIEQRADSLKPYLDRGSVGITNDGLLVLRSSEGLNLKEKADIARLIDAENNDRNSLYSEIAKANNYGAERIPDVKEIFAKSWIKNAKAGWWIQSPDGSWSQKK